MGIEFAKQRYGFSAGGSCFRQGWIAGDHHVRLPATAPGAGRRGAERQHSMSLFVDTSIWYAAADASDRSNSRAKTILGSGEALVTTDHILVETWTLLHPRLQRKAVERFSTSKHIPTPAGR